MGSILHRSFPSGSIGTFPTFDVTAFISRARYPLLLLLLLAGTFAVYVPGLWGSFIFDDFVNIVTNDNVRLNQLTLPEFSKVWNSGISSDLKRPLSMLSFGFNFYFTGIDPFYFKLTNVVIHLLTATGFYFLTVELFRLAAPTIKHQQQDARLMALVVAACWALHPLNVSSVMYVVQRMTQLSALSVVCILLYYCHFRQRETCSALQGAVGFLALGALIVIGMLFKENVILVVPFILCIEYFLLQFKTTTAGHKLFFKLFLPLMVILPGLGVLGLLIVSPASVIGDYGLRTFTVWERLLTESRVLWTYVSWLLLPDTRELVFHHDNFPVSRGLFAPPTTLLACLGLLSLGGLCLRFGRRFPIPCFGIAFFLAGHLIESTVINLELVFEHRNYLPGFGVLLAVVYLLVNAPTLYLSRPVTTGLLGIYLVFLAHGTYSEARKWSDNYIHMSTIVHQNPGSHRTNYAMGFELMTLATLTPDNSVLFDSASRYFREAIALDPIAVRGHAGLIMADSQNGKPLEDAVIEGFAQRLRTNNIVRDGFNEISMVVDCRYSGFCKFDRAIMFRLLRALSENRVNQPVVIQGILGQIGDALGDRFRRYEDAREVYYLARNLRPDFTSIDLRLIHVELTLGNVDAARRLIAEAQPKEASPSLRTELQRLATSLETPPTTPQ